MIRPRTQLEVSCYAINVYLLDAYCVKIVSYLNYDVNAASQHAFTVDMIKFASKYILTRTTQTPTPSPCVALLEATLPAATELACMVSHART